MKKKKNSDSSQELESFIFILENSFIEVDLDGTEEFKEAIEKIIGLAYPSQFYVETNINDTILKYHKAGTAEEILSQIAVNYGAYIRESWNESEDVPVIKIIRK